MVKFFKKLLICICIMLVISNFMINTLTFADETATQIKESTQESDSSIGDKLTEVLSGIVGMLTWFPRVMIIGGTSIIQVVGAGIANMAGEITGEDIGLTLSPDDVIFNKIHLTSIDFFDLSLPDSNIVKQIREQIALWYYIMRMIAIAILLGILIFVGIRMAITTIASEKAIYKKALFDWVTSLALVFLLHYIIRAVLWMNTSLVEIFQNIAADMDLDNILSALRSLAFDKDFTTGWGAVIVYVIITVQSLMFLISYIKRMLVIAFLIIISPLITITYSIDKMGDQKAQALNTWLKEFIFNVLIQPFHCILYLAFVSIAIEALKVKASIGALLLACLCIKFVWDGEKIVRKIFGFEQASSLAAAAASGAVLGSMINKASSAGKTAAGGIKYAKNSKTGQILKQKHQSKVQERKDLKGLSRNEKRDYRDAKKRGDTDLMNTFTEKASKNRETKAAAKAGKPIHKMKENVKSRVNTAKTNISNTKVGKAVGNAGRKIKGVASTVANSDLGKAIGSDVKRFTRKITRPENIAKVSAGIMAGAAMLALPDSNFVTAAIGGYSAGKHAESKVREMRTRKSENYEEQLSRAWETHCNSTPGLDKNDKNAFTTWVSNMNNAGKLDRYSQKNVDKKEKEVISDMEKLNIPDSVISNLIAEIQKAILSGNVCNPTEIAGQYGIDPRLISGLTDMYNNQRIFEKTDAFDTQMEQYGYSHEDVVEEMSFSSTNTNIETVRTIDDIKTDYGTDNLADIDNQIDEKLRRAETELEMAVSNSGVSTTNNELETLERTVQMAMDRGVSDIENIIKSELNKIQPNVISPTSEVIREIKTHITEKHTLERDREIIQKNK